MEQRDEEVRSRPRHCRRETCCGMGITARLAKAEMNRRKGASAIIQAYA